MSQNTNTETIPKKLIGTFFAFVFGVVLGPGFIWNYFERDVAEENLDLAKIEARNNLRASLLSLQGDIISGVRPYVTARDSLDSEDKGALLNQTPHREYVLAKTRIVGLINQYNSTEAQLALLESRQAKWFVTGELIPPRAPILKNTGSSKTPIVVKDGTATLVVEYELRFDEVIMITTNAITELADQYGPSLTYEIPEQEFSEIELFLSTEPITSESANLSRVKIPLNGSIKSGRVEIPLTFESTPKSKQADNAVPDE